MIATTQTAPCNDPCMIARKRSMLLSTRLRFAPQVQPLRETAIDKILEQNLLIADDDEGVTVQELERGGALSLTGGVTALHRADIQQALQRLEHILGMGFPGSPRGMAQSSSLKIRGIGFVNFLTVRRKAMWIPDWDHEDRGLMEEAALLIRQAVFKEWCSLQERIANYEFADSHLMLEIFAIKYRALSLDGRCHYQGVVPTKAVSSAQP
jgi:hypothetical protein